MKTTRILWRDLLRQVRLVPFFALLAAASVHAQSPNLINYQGRLTDAQGNPVTGNRTMVVKVYDAPNGGNVTYQENIGTVAVTNGTYSFQFGDEGDGIIAVLIGFSDYLSLTVNGTEEATRTRLLAVPYSLKSADAQALAGKVESVSGNVTTIQSQTASLTSNVTALQGQSSGLSANFGTLNATVGALGSNVTALQVQTSALGSNVTALQSQNSGLSSNLGTLNATVGALGSNVTELQGQSAALSSNVTTLQTQSAGLSTSFGTLNATVGALGSNVTALQSQATGLGSGQASLNAAVGALGSNVTALQNQTSALSTSVGNLNGTVSALGSNLTALQSQTASLGGNLQMTSAAAARSVLYSPYQAGQSTLPGAHGAISFQGVALEDGQPVNGTRNISIKLFDSAIGGTELYSENMGNVTVTNGVFSVEYGASGTSNALTSETVATTNGTASNFQKVLSATTVVAGSVTVTDGTYTWDQTNGSSNENDFGVSYNSSLRRVTVNYYNGAPSSGTTISASYRTPAAGISGAISDGSQPWLETTINGKAQTPRQKVLTVPFAARAAIADALAEDAASIIPMPFYPLASPPIGLITSGEGTQSGADASFIFYSQEFYLPPSCEALRIKYNASWKGDAREPSGRSYTLDFSVRVGGVEVHSFSFNGMQDNNNPVTISFEKLAAISHLGLQTGFTTFTIHAVKRNYGSGAYAVTPSSGTCSLWIVSEAL